MIERSWFNIFDYPDLYGQRYIDKKSIDNSTKVIHREIKDQYNLLGDYKNVYLGSFSQGGCMSLHSALTLEEELGGVISFNGFKFDFTPVDKKKERLKILAINGMLDDTVIVREARRSFSVIKKHFKDIKFIEEVGLYHTFSKSGIEKANMLLELESDRESKNSDNIFLEKQNQPSQSSTYQII